jgi:hypothetical protein
MDSALTLRHSQPFQTPDFTLLPPLPSQNHFLHRGSTLLHTFSPAPSLHLSYSLSHLKLHKKSHHLSAGASLLYKAGRNYASAGVQKRSVGGLLEVGVGREIVEGWWVHCGGEGGLGGGRGFVAAGWRRGLFFRRFVGRF